MKTIKLIAAAAVAFAALQAPLATAAYPDEDSAVSKNFKQVGRTLRGLRSAETAEDVAEILTKVKKFSEKASALTPTIMAEGSDSEKEYKEGMKKFIAQVDKALKLAKDGDKDGALKIAKTFTKAKKDAHKHFNVEWRR